ncbi:MAG: hypothetical protein QOJ59_3792 [Thermomicrobiales bacterium]|jgi:hypothetical protein|nr:hypothetical protein [Thermomicrobiales bacterium]
MRRKDRDPATTAYGHKVDQQGNHFCDVRILTDRGEVIDDTVLDLAMVEGVLMPVARDDSAHGYPHRDTLDWDGHVAEKLWMPLQSLSEALNHAVEEVKTLWPGHFEAFLLRRPLR